MSELRKIAAVPTLYSGVRFRSRLEARWACLFDRLKWRWFYEPEDLPGWIPDFLIQSDAGADLLCEVKPIRQFDQPEAQEAVMDVWRAAPRDAHALLCGLEAVTFMREPGHPVPDIALGAPKPWHVGWAPTPIGWIGVDKADIWPIGAEKSLIFGALPGGRINPNDLRELWISTLNDTQYKAPK